MSDHIPKIEKYLIHDNGGRPFKVKIIDTSIYIYKVKYDDDCNATYNEMILSILTYKNIFIGDDPGYPQFKGNSILIQIDARKYIYVGWYIYSFKIDDTITSYYSRIGNSDVPYPYAVGTKNTYLMSEHVYIPNETIRYNDPYDQYYNHDNKNDPDLEFTKYKSKQLHERI